MRTKILALASACLLLSSWGLRAQQPTIKSGPTVTVPLYVTVTDMTKRLVPGLLKEDFTVLDNGKPQTITIFDNEVRPITVVVMLDTSGSMTMNLDLLRQAAEQFVIRLMPDDQAMIGAFNDKIEFAGTGFTNDRDTLASEIRELDYGNATRLWDAVDESFNKLEGMEGRKVIVVFTDGDDTGSRVGRGKLIERARLDEVMIYAIGLESIMQPQGGPRIVTRPDRGLKGLAQETGGGYFELKKTDELNSTFTRVAQELHSQYVLGFTPEKLDGKLHKVEVKMRDPQTTGRARQSYVATPVQGQKPKS